MFKMIFLYLGKKEKVACLVSEIKKKEDILNLRSENLKDFKRNMTVM